MRKLVTTLATAVTLGVAGFAAPALADSPLPQPGFNLSTKGQPNPYAGDKFDTQRFDDRKGGDRNFDGQYQDRGYEDRGYDDRGFDNRGFPGRDYDNRRFDRDGNFSITFDFGRQNGAFDRWERGWGQGGYRDQYQFQQPLNYWRLNRRLEAQGFYGVRGLRPARWGFGYRAFAYNYRGQPVMLRINPYTGRVLDVRYI